MVERMEGGAKVFEGGKVIALENGLSVKLGRLAFGVI